jgi:hypothetical protein
MLMHALRCHAAIVIAVANANLSAISDTKMCLLPRLPKPLLLTPSWRVDPQMPLCLPLLRLRL